MNRQRPRPGVARKSARRDGQPATVLVNAAGIQRRTDFAGCDEATWAELMDINMNGVYRSCQVFGEGMRERRRDDRKFQQRERRCRLRQGHALWHSKAAVSFMTKVIAVEWAPAVRANAIAPTAVPFGHDGRPLQPP